MSQKRYPNINLYKKIGLSNFCSKEEVDRRRRTLALIHHPDRGGDQNQMKSVNAICDILTKEKEDYDNHLMLLLNPRPAFGVVISSYGWTYTGSNTTNTTVWF